MKKVINVSQNLMVNINKIIQKKFNESDISKINDAYSCALLAHINQKRKNGDPYIIHPIEVSMILLELDLDADTIIAGILHDCIEDTQFNYNKIKNKFGDEIVYLVDGVTKLSQIKYYTQEQQQMENLRKMFMAMAKDIRVILIKLADRLHNMRTIEYVSIKKQKDKAFETIEIYAPIAHRLGMQKIKWELEDLSLKYLDPIGYYEITQKLKENDYNRKIFLECIIHDIKNKLKETKINFKIQYRIKNIYSIYRKIFYQKKIIDQIYDICAIRIIVNSIQECYNILGMIHDLYKNVSGRFKDYISIPKSNNYQSLHTTVISKNGIQFEVQIRTKNMHETAEYGVAAHWKYKKNINNTKSNDDKTFNWIRRLLESQENTQISDFLRTLKFELFADDVFVFTPKGDVINLPKGAIAIDFAYEIHSEIGNNIIGCKINNIDCSITNKLKNGDIIEIIVSNNSKGPCSEWLNFVKTSEAKNKIKQWLKKKNKIININNGFNILKNNLISHNLYYIYIKNKKIQKNLLNTFSIKSLEDLYILMSLKAIKINKIINKIKSDLFDNI